MLEAALTGASDLQHTEQDENVTKSLPAEPTRQETTRQLESAATNESHFEVENLIDPTPPTNPPREVPNDSDYETMLYPYPHYNDEADAEDHVRAFQTTWQENRVAQRLAATNANGSKIDEFGLSLDGQSTNSYSQHNITEFQDFEHLKENFVRLFHKRIP